MADINSPEQINGKGFMLGDLWSMQVIDNNDTFFKKEPRQSFIDRLDSPGA